MAQSEEWRSECKEWLKTVSVGLLFVLLGVIWLITPDHFSEVIDSAMDFHLEHVGGGRK